MAYLIVYPIIYPGLAVVLTIVNPRLWLTNALFLCIIPALYWYVLLWMDGRLNLRDFSLLESSGMSVIILAALGLSMGPGFVASKRGSKLKRQTALPVSPAIVCVSVSGQSGHFWN